MKLTMDVTQERTGGWIAEVPELPGVQGIGATEDAATRAARALAFRVLADLLEIGELSDTMLHEVSFGE